MDLGATNYFCKIPIDSPQLLQCRSRIGIPTEQMALACCLDGTGGNSGDAAICDGALSVSPVVATMPPGRNRADLNIVCALSATAKSKTGARGLRFVEPHAGVKGKKAMKWARAPTGNHLAHRKTYRENSL